jgi:hypothetical protein
MFSRKHLGYLITLHLPLSTTKVLQVQLVSCRRALSNRPFFNLLFNIHVFSHARFLSSNNFMIMAVGRVKVSETMLNVCQHTRRAFKLDLFCTRALLRVCSKAAKIKIVHQASKLK